MIEFFARTLLALVVLMSGIVQPAVANALKSKHLPICGPDNAAFDQLLIDLKQQLAWLGNRTDGSDALSGVLELTIGRSGRWSLFYRFVGVDGNKRICLVSRGIDARIQFGRAM